MTVTVKLDPALEERLRLRAAGSGTSTSEVIRSALVAYLGDGDNAAAAQVSPFSLGSGLFGRYGGEATLAQNRKRSLSDAWADKHGGRGV